MATKSKQFLLPDQKFFEACEKKQLYEYDNTCSPEKRSQSDKKVKDFDPKYAVPEPLKLVQLLQYYLSVAAGEFPMSTEPSSSFQAAIYGKDFPQSWKELISLVAAHESESNSAALEILGEQGKHREELGTTVANSSTSPNNLNHTSTPPHSTEIQHLRAMVYNCGCRYSAINKTAKKRRKKFQRKIVKYYGCDAICNSNIACNIIIGNHNSKPFSQVNRSPNIVPSTTNEASANINHNSKPCSRVNRSPNIASSTNNEGSAIIKNIFSPTASNEPTKLAIATFAAINVELVSTLSNSADNSSRVKEHQIVRNIVLISSTIAFPLSLTALVLLDKMPVAAKKIQKTAFLFGAFGYMGILGLLMPPSIMLWFTISAFVFCFLIFTTAIFM